MNPSSFFSLCGAALQGSARAGQAWAAYRGLRRSQWLSAAEVERLQLAKARLLLKHCIENVPYYRRLSADAGIGPEDVRTMDDFRRIPLLSRRTYQERFGEFQARALPPGVAPAGATSTSGTSGVAVKVLQTDATNRWWRALYLRDLEWCGVDPRGALAVIRPIGDKGTNTDGETASLPCWAPELHGLIETGPSHGLDIHQDPRRQLAWLRRVAPNYLLSYPANLDHLAGLMQDEGVPLPALKGIQSISETLTDEARARIESAFGVPVKDVYSACEAGYLASPCPDGRGLHVHAEHVLLEVLDADDRPCAPGQTGRVVLTTLHNYLTPLVRYEIMDEATVGPAACPCGRGLPLLAKVHGKRRPLFRLPSGRVKHPSGLVVALRGLGGVRQQQIVQRAVDRFLVRVTPGREWTAEHPERIRRLVREHAEAPVAVAVEIRERLNPAPGGKLVDVVSELEAPPAVGQWASPAASDFFPPSPPFRGRGDGGEGEGIRSPTCALPLTPNPSPPKRGRGERPAVLLGWELGAGSGYVRRLVLVGRELASRGYRPVLAVRSLADAQPALKNVPFPVLQAPIWRGGAGRDGRPFLAASYADVLAVHGYAAVEDLARMVQAWQELIDRVQPALVVCENSPTLCLASRGTLPAVVLGYGFILPPVEAPIFPPMLPGRSLLVPEAELLAVVREVQRRRGRPAPDTLPGLLAGSERFLTVFPELDPYQTLRQEPAMGPLEDLAPLTPPPAQPSYFAYLNAEAAGLEQLLGGLVRSGCPGKVFLRGASAELRGRLRTKGLEILDALPSPADAVPPASVVVHHAGVGLAQQALAAGRPQLVFPGHLEQVLNAQLVHALGVGHYVLGTPAEEVVAQEVRQILGAPDLAAQALARAASLHRRGPWDPLPRIVESCLVLLEQSRSSPSSNTVEVSYP